MKFVKFNSVFCVGFVFVVVVLVVFVMFVGGIYGGGYDELLIGEVGVVVNVICMIEVDVVDSMCFMFLNVLVKKGEIICFVIKNFGKVLYEFSFGMEKEFKEYYEVMKKNLGMEYEEVNKILFKFGK